MNLSYLFSKVVKKLHGRALLRSTIHPSSKVEAGTEGVEVTMGRHSFCGYFCDINYCDVGSFCSIASHVVIGGGLHPKNWVSTSPAFYAGRDSIAAKFSEHPRPPPLRTTIGHDVWIGQGAFIRQGVTIGIGAIVGMGAVVTRNISPYEIVAGVPARVIGARFPDELCQRLLLSRWWELDDSTLREAAVYVQEPVRFLEAIGK